MRVNESAVRGGSERYARVDAGVRIAPDSSYAIGADHTRSARSTSSNGAAKTPPAGEFFSQIAHIDIRLQRDAAGVAAAAR